MEAASKLALKTCILKVLPDLEKLSKRFHEQYLVWKKQDAHSWRGEFQLKPSINQVFGTAHNQLEKFGSEFSDVFFSAHPEYASGLVGLSGLGAQNLSHDKGYLLRTVLQTLWERHHTFSVNETMVDAVVDEFSDFVDQPKVTLRFQAELLNFRMSDSVLSLAGNLTIRRLTEEEVSAFSGGPVSMLGLHRSRTAGIHEFAIEGEYQQEKLFETQLNADRSAFDDVKSRLDRAILALRTFKEGRVGYDWIRQKFLGCCPLMAPSIGFSDLHVPAGIYEIPDNELEALAAHARLIFRITEPAMETACRRLADAETRNRPEDQIVDAVIGMEALLLAALGKEDRRSELKYRFSIHYSTLFEGGTERRRAFKVAKDLYDLRSILAHGSDVGHPPYRVGEEKLTLVEAAKRAREALRKTINQFLPTPETANYKDPEFWERAYFGLAREKT